MVTKESIGFVDTDVANHFTDALVYRASEYEDIDLTGTAGLGGEARCYITAFRVVSSQNLAWALAVHNKANSGAGTDSVIGHTFNNNSWIDYWSWVDTDAMPVGTSFVYAVTGMKIPYRDDDRTGRLHLSLHNNSTTSKIAATGYVQVRIGFSGAA